MSILRLWPLLAGVLFCGQIVWAQTPPDQSDEPAALANTAPETPLLDPTLAPTDANREKRSDNATGCKYKLDIARTGVASWYGAAFHGKRTANGERFNMNDFTAAHKTLPFGTRVLVTNIRTGAEVTVRINDRGPYVRGRVLDLSASAANRLGIKGQGTALISYKVLGKGC